MFSNVKLSRISPYVNCWRIQIDTSRIFAVLPAHVAVHKKNDMWKKSFFLDKCNRGCGDKLNWKIPLKWTENHDPHNDIAWAEIKDCIDISLKETKHDINNPIDTSFYYSHTIDHAGKICADSVFGKMNGTVYASPNSTLLEVPNIGFKGMSGAIAVDDNGDCIGMLLRRGSNLGERDLDGTEGNYKFSKNLTPMRRSLIMPFGNILSHINSNKSICVDELIKNK